LLAALKLFCEGSSEGTRLLLQFPGTPELLKEQLQDEEELSANTAVSAHWQNALDCLLDTSISHFGFAAGDVYGGIFQFQQHTSDRNLEHMSLERLREVASSLAVGLGGIEEPETSTRIFALFPVLRGRYVDGVDWKVDFKSAWVAKQFMDLLEAADDDEVRQQISFFKRLPETNDIAAYLVEPLIHRMLADTHSKDL